MGAPQAAGPAFIDPGVSQNAQFFGTQSPPLPAITANGGKLYLYQQTIGSGGANINGCAVYRSTDGGTTWTELDAANAPTSAVGAFVLDSANKQLIFGLVTITSPATAQALFLKNFNLTTEKWGANYATGGPNANTVVNSVFKRPDASVVVVYDFGSGNPGGTSRLRAAVWNGATWSTSIDLGAAMLPSQADGNINVSGTCCAMDSTGIVHAAYVNNAGTLFFYQQLLTNNALGPSNQFTIANFSNSAFGSLLIYRSSVLISYLSAVHTQNTLLIGTPLAAPAWSTVNPAALAGSFRNTPAPLATDGTNLVWMINPIISGIYDAFQLATSTDGGQTWTIIQSNLTAPFFYDMAPGQSPLAPNADPTFGSFAPVVSVLNINGTATVFGFNNVRNSAQALQMGYFMNSLALGAAPTTPTKLEISLFGVKRWPKSPDGQCVEVPEPVPLKRVM